MVRIVRRETYKLYYRNKFVIIKLGIVEIKDNESI